MNTLLQQCLDEVAMKEHGGREFTNIKSSGQPIHYFLSIKRGMEAAELALSRMQEQHEKELERQKQFYEWILSRERQFQNTGYLTTEELYQIWREKTKL